MEIPAARRVAIVTVEQTFGPSERRARRPIGRAESSLRCRFVQRDDERLQELAMKWIRFGYRRFHRLLRRKGYRTNRKRDYRVHRDLGLAGSLTMEAPSIACCSSASGHSASGQRGVIVVKSRRAKANCAPSPSSPQSPDPPPHPPIHRASPDPSPRSDAATRATSSPSTRIAPTTSPRSA
jgi:hypothetical protein